MQDRLNLVECTRCGYIHFEVSKAYVRDWEIQWLRYFNEMDTEWLSLYGVTIEPPSSDEYLFCFKCRSSYKHFKPANEQNVPRGITINGILNRNEAL